MRIIKKLQDIELLKEKQVMSKEVLEELEEHFKNIYRNLGLPEGTDIEEFSLKECGIMVYLEAGDNITDLEEIGLSPEDDGLLGSTPEWVDEQILDSCTLVTVCILYNNECALSIFFRKEDFKNELEEWVSDYI
ncbi:hypothetical protein NBE98_08560 [Clostridium swellfunianum]|uniref:hypothetical protein n=1 Tax=Clostridium swellfunianum TaxID=1367462 RepID=UPI00202F4637|nr:hypothetical protein [Clostridium swellfunianum]MCM0648424.1 hypothetical protein [Clostridium swellfunianum]